MWGEEKRTDDGDLYSVDRPISIWHNRPCCQFISLSIFCPDTKPVQCSSRHKTTSRWGGFWLLKDIVVNQKKKINRVTPYTNAELCQFVTLHNSESHLQSEIQQLSNSLSPPSASHWSLL